MWFDWLPVGVQFFFKVRSFYTHYSFVGATFINRYQPVPDPIRFSRPELDAVHLESALDEQRPILRALCRELRPTLPVRPGIEPETCSQSFSHNTKALALYFWSYSFGWVRNHQEPAKHLEKSIDIDRDSNRAVWLAVRHSTHCATALLGFELSVIYDIIF